MNSNNEQINEVLGEVKQVVKPHYTVQLDTGNFSVIVSGEVKEDVVSKFVKQGLVYDLQRGPATKAYIALAGVPAKKKDVMVLPEKFVRKSVAYSSDNAKVMQAAVLKEFGSKLDNLKVTVVQYVPDESSDGRVKAKLVFGKWQEAGLVEKKVGLWETASDLVFKGDLENEEDVIEFIHQCLVSPAS